MIIIAVAPAIPPGLQQLEESLIHAPGRAGQLRRRLGAFRSPLRPPATTFTRSSRMTGRTGTTLVGQRSVRPTCRDSECPVVPSGVPP